MNKTSKRRFFLKTVTATASLAIVRPQSVRGSGANSKITLGLIGSGGRGFFVCKKFIDTVGDEIHLSMAHDYFPDRMERFQNLFDIPESRCYSGLNGYREILNSSVDGVIITSPPYFHPQHTADAVSAGKHVWLSKPVAVDVPGCMSILESGRRAKDGSLTLLVDFQSRNSPHFVEAVERVHGGAIGELVSGQAFNHFPCGGWWDAPGTTDEIQLRNWGTNPVLSGDIIVEQAVHAVDIANWIAGTHPTKAYGTGGLKARLNAGKNWDHFIVTYWYGDGPVIDLNVAQFTRGYEDLGARFYGKLGVVDAHYRSNDWGVGPITITGDNAWPGVPHDNTWDIGVENNCRDFVQSVRNGLAINHTGFAADSTLSAILGRKAAYQHGEVSWDDMMNDHEKLNAGLSR